MLTERTIMIPIYKHRLRICVCDSINEARDKYPFIGENTDGCTVEYNGNKTLIIVEPNDIPIIVHECYHVKDCIWRRIGYTPQNNNNEVDAYLIEHIFEEVMKVVRQHLKKSTKNEVIDK